ncbi:MAG: acetyl-CoA carboxylase biotin carboxyl carrier protein [Oscillospiraceae bacterium]
MSEKRFSTEEIKELMEKMQKVGLGLLEINDDDYSFKLEAKKGSENQATTPITTQTSAIISQTTEITQDSTTQIKQEENATGNVVVSPIVGTFYVSAAPDKPPFVKIGDKVKKGDILFVIESMKLMNEIQSEFDGEILKIMVSDSQGVEYGQPIMIIE